MKIALVSYEYPPDTAFGGISTYVNQISRVLQTRGHHVEVFSASISREVTEIDEGIVIHRILETDRTKFRESVVKIFLERHHLINFDVIEGPEFNADAREIVQVVPDIPLVLKFHTPLFLIKKLNLLNPEPSLLMKIRWYFGQMRRGIELKAYWKYIPEEDIEYLHSSDADECVFPTTTLAKLVFPKWKIDSSVSSVVPYPYIPTYQLLNISTKTSTNTITYIGRLETRKGVLDLAEAIPLILDSCPDVKFRFVGRSNKSPQPGLNMQQYLSKILDKYSHLIEFTGGVSSDKIPYYLANTDICVFPSIWENFPNVCLEAMSAARGIVGSSAGGMIDMLDHGQAGILIPPKKPRQLAHAILQLLHNPKLRMKLGENARNRVLREYNADRIGSLQEASYARAIERRKLKGCRNTRINQK